MVKTTMPAARPAVDDRAALFAQIERKNVLTPREAALLLGRSRSTVELWCRNDTLPARRIGSRFWLTKSDLVRDGWLVATPTADLAEAAS
jgi:excisionase family DNA binding protein